MPTDICSICNLREDKDWLQCDHCGQWYHVACVGISKVELDSLLSYHCKNCVAKSGPSEYRRRLKRSRVQIDYVALNDGEVFAVDKSMHPHVHKFLEFPVDANKQPGFIDVEKALLFDTVVKLHLPRPVLVPNATKQTVGMILPTAKENITIDYILEKVGGDTPVEVMDVLSQQGVSPRWDMQQWRDYFVNLETRDRIRNVISLEISQVDGLGKQFKRPDMVDEIDLIDKSWNDKSERPQVTKYCLMSVAGSFTDYHIDFGGTSVYYTVCSGAKTFLMFPPTDLNLSLYTSWCLEPNQNFMWFPEYLKTYKGKRAYPSGGFKVTLSPGDVFIIPSGWIHAVYTPSDSIVIGGNYLTLMSMKTQLDIYRIEKETHVPMKFRHPQFNKVLWLAAWYFWNHKSEFWRDIGETNKSNGTVKKESHDSETESNGSEKSVLASTIVSSLVSHLESHLELSKTNQTAKKSIPYGIIGKDVEGFLSKLKVWASEM